MTCSFHDCENEGRAIPVLLLYAHRGHKPAQARLGMQVCGKHQESATIDQLLGDDGWKFITDGFAAKGLRLPVRELVELDWQLLC